MSLAQRTRPTANKGEQETFEKGGRLVQTLLERVEEVDVELLGLIDVLADSVKDDHLEEPLDNVRLAGDKDPRGLIAGIGGPTFRLGDLEDVLPVGNCREDLEGLWQRAGLVSREDLADPT